MSRTTRRHLPPSEHGKVRRRSNQPRHLRELSKTTKQRRVNERAALRREYRNA